jgi:outer membrane lipoprotein-sorting protein
VVSAQTLDEILAKNLEARGGIDAILAIKSARASGTMTMGPGMEAPFTWEWKDPNRFRIDFTIQGQTGTQAFDGDKGWMHMPFMGKTDPELVPEDQYKDMAQQADFHGSLVNYKEKGHQVELIGKEDIEGTEAFKLKVTLKDGDVLNMYLDAEYFLEIKVEGHHKRGDTNVVRTTTLGDYKDVNGMMFPFSISNSQEGMPGSQTITFDKIDMNIDIDDARFAFPK